jgi:hypothetical protein
LSCLINPRNSYRYMQSFLGDRQRAREKKAQETS